MTLMINRPTTNVHVYYHWWSHPDEPPAYENLRTPVVLSIATLRAVSDVPITVLDVSDGDTEPAWQWGHFRDKLNFRVLKVPCGLRKYKERFDGWQYMARIFDLRTSTASNVDAVLYCDSDVFWLKNPLPLNKSPDKFCFDGWNSGLFYYDPKSNNVELFHEVFESYTKASIYSEDVRKIMRRHLGYDGWYGVWDEMILTYMAHEHPNLFNLIPVEEHSTARVLQYADREATKMFHCNGTMVNNPLTGDKHCRGLMALLVKEFYSNLLKVLDENDLKLIFGQTKMNYCLEKQFSLWEDKAAFLATRDEEGHYHAQKVLTP